MQGGLRLQEPLMSNTPHPVLSVHSLDMEQCPEARRPSGAAAAKFHVERAPLTERLGLTTLGINVTCVAPGKTA
jgi:hypothetical protein